MEELLFDIALTAGQKSAATFAAKVGTSVASSLLGLGLSSFVKKQMVQAELNKNPEPTPEELNKLNLSSALVGCVITGTFAGLGTLAFKELSSVIDNSDKIESV